jgi:hypothetical protein
MLEAVEGAKSLCDWFGYWPSFHDAEVISLHLNRRGLSSLALHTWEMTKDLTDYSQSDRKRLVRTVWTN